MRGDDPVRLRIDINEEQAITPGYLVDFFIEELHVAARAVARIGRNDRRERDVRDVRDDDCSSRLRFELFNNLFVVARKLRRVSFRARCR